MVAAARATEVDSAIEALGFETEPLRSWASARLERGLAPKRHRFVRRLRQPDHCVPPRI
jgi:hypothetical protein